jgi:uncharacterized membrane protein
VVVAGAVVLGAAIGAAIGAAGEVVAGAAVSGVVWAKAGTAAPSRAAVETAARNRVVKVMDVSEDGTGVVAARSSPDRGRCACVS